MGGGGGGGGGGLSCLLKHERIGEIEIPKGKSFHSFVATNEKA